VGHAEEGLSIDIDVVDLAGAEQSLGKPNDGR